METTYKPGEPNYAISVDKDWDEILVGYATVVDLKKETFNKTLFYTNQTDQNVLLKISTGTNHTSWRIHAGATLEIKDFKHQGLVEHKYESIPSTGFIRFMSW